jgi:hypothetical protein
MSKNTNVIPKNNKTQKKWDLIFFDYAKMYSEGWNHEYIQKTLAEKYFLSAITIKIRISQRAAVKAAKKFPVRENAMADLSIIETR